MVGHFSIVPAEVALDNRLTKMQLRVLIALLSFREKNTDTVWPKRETLAARCGYTVVTISRVTTQLVELGWLEKKGSGGCNRPSQYRITVPELATVSPAEDEAQTVTEQETVSTSATVAEPVTPTVTEPDNKRCPNQSPAKNRPRTNQGTDQKEMFDALWDSWPAGFGDKGSKKNAEAAFLKLKPDKALFADMIRARDAQARDKASRRAAGVFAPPFQHVERWIKNERWKDEIDPINAISYGAAGVGQSGDMAERAARLAFGDDAGAQDVLDGDFCRVDPDEAAYSAIRRGSQ